MALSKKGETRSCPASAYVQIATLDDPDAVPPRGHMQVADRIGWMKTAHQLPEHERYPEIGG
jgi:hypothetical protein